MKNYILILISILIGGQMMAQDYSFSVAKTGKNITLDTLAGKLKAYDVVFFGEYHDNADVHAAQITLLEKMYESNKRLILSFEMFERDVQPLLDAYLKGEVSEADFLAGARAWSNYETDYKPLIEFAKTKGLQCIAANVPRRLAGKAARSGETFCETLSEEELSYIAKELNIPSGKYRNNFFQTMADNGMHGSADDEAFMDNLYLAQCLKDDTMAEAILKYRKQYPKYRILHFNGDFHSREFLGTVERCLWRAPKLKVAVITPHFKGSLLPENATEIATYFVLIPEPPAEDTPQEGTP